MSNVVFERVKQGLPSVIIRPKKRPMHGCLRLISLTLLLLVGCHCIEGLMASSSSSSNDRLTRISVVDIDRCKPAKCGQECRKGCPVNSGGKKCLTIVPRTSGATIAVSLMALIDEALCIGCGLCVRVRHTMHHHSYMSFMFMYGINYIIGMSIWCH